MKLRWLDLVVFLNPILKQTCISSANMTLFSECQKIGSNNLLSGRTRPRALFSKTVLNPRRPDNGCLVQKKPKTVLMLSQVITYQWLTNWLHKSVIKRFQFSGFPCLVLYYLTYSIWILLLIFLSKMEKKNPSLSNLRSKWENLSLGFTFLQGNRWFIYRIARITLFNAQMVRIKITTTDYFHPWDWETGMIPWMLYTFYKSLFF